MPLKDNQLLNIKALNLELNEIDEINDIEEKVTKTEEEVNQMMIKTDGLEKMLQILKLNLHAENTEIRILLRQISEQVGKVENKQEATIQKLTERRGFVSRLKYLFTGF